MKRALFYCLLLLLPAVSLAQLQDTAINSKDILAGVSRRPVAQTDPLKKMLKENNLLNSEAKPESIFQKERNPILKDPVFYFIAVLFLFLGILRISFDKYFSNLLRVFFNTSLRQSQLTDQLLQARLPSLFFNIFFVIIGGLYLYLLLIYFGKTSYYDWDVLTWCILAVLAIYVAKFAVMRFAGWLTGYQQEAETYVFIVFLVNKMISLILVPLVVIIAFSTGSISKVGVIISYIMIGLMLSLRFFRSYGLLQNRLKVSRFHFILYIIGIELLPILLVYKGALLIMSKNL